MHTKFTADEIERRERDGACELIGFWAQDHLFSCYDCPTYAELKERAEERIKNATPGSVLRAVKLMLYIEHRAYREAMQLV